MKLFCRELYWWTRDSMHLSKHVELYTAEREFYCMKATTKSACMAGGFGMQTMTRESNCTSNESHVALKAMGEKGAELRNSGKLCFD